MPEQRRGQRAFLRVHVIVRGRTSEDQPFHEQTQTLVVGPYGALLNLAAKVERGQVILLTNRATRESQECRIVYMGEATDGKGEAAVEFAKAAPNFWQVTFPPQRDSLAIAPRLGVGWPNI